MRLLVSRNLDLRFTEYGHEQLDAIQAACNENNPDLIVVAGNVSQYEKRSILFAEQVAERTGKRVVYNVGILEYCSLVAMEKARKAILFRIKMNQEKTNVFWAEDFVSNEIEFKSVLGLPTITDTEENFKKTFVGRWFIKSRSPYYLNGEFVTHNYPMTYSLAEFNEEAAAQATPEWSQNKKKILLSAVGQNSDERLNVNFVSAPSYGADLVICSSGSQIEIIDI